MIAACPCGGNGFDVSRVLRSGILSAMARVACATLLCVWFTAPGCAATATWPYVVSLDDARATPVKVGAWIDSYEQALVSIAAIMRDELALPEVQAALQFYKDRAGLRAALEANGYGPELARQTAETMIAVAGPRRVLINEASLRPLEWPHRVALLAHELTHTLQYEWGGGRRGTSEQWLREGFAEWVEVKVLEALRLTTWPQARTLAIRRLRDAGGAASLRPLTELVTFPDWVSAVSRDGEDAVYAHAMLAAELLVSRHGMDAVVRYFESFAGSGDRLDNFRRAFGQDLDAFDAAAQEALARLLR